MRTLIFLIVVSAVTFAQTEKASLLQLKSEMSQIELPSNQSDVETSVQSGKKNAGLAVLYSLLLPGMGELYAGSYNSGKYFTIAEGAIWLTYTGMYSYGNWKENNYKSYAQSYAGVVNSGKDDDYYANVGNYSSIDQFNREKALEGNFNEMYNVEQNYWNWSSEQQRKEYRGLWSSSENAYNNLQFVVGALVLNRIISAVNAARLVSAYNKSLDAQSAWNVSFNMGTPQTKSGLTLNLSTSF
jgi:hypothetical protein